MKKLLALAAIPLVVIVGTAHADFTAGNLAVVQVGDGTTTLSGLGNNVAITEYTTAGGLVQSFGIPQSTPFSMTGNATAEGALSLSQDGTALTFAGYSSGRLSSGSLAGSTAAAVPRVVAQMTSSGAFSTPVVANNQFSANSIRSAVTDASGNYWALGVGQGVTYMGNNASAAVIETAQTTLRVMNIVGGNLYFTAAGGVFSLSGEPQSGTATPTQIIIGAGTGPSTYDFAFNPANTIAYVADDRTTVNGGGIERYDWNGSAWVFSYTMSTGGTSGGARGLAVDWTTGFVYATTTESANNRLVKIVDGGSTALSVETDLATAGSNKAFRGLEWAPVPEPSSVALLGLGIGALIVRRRK